MKSFAAWLHDLKNDDPYLAGLQAFATANAATWPYWSDKLDDFKKIVAAAPAASQPDLHLGLATYFERWSALQNAKSSDSSLSANPGKTALMVFGLVLAALIVFALFNSNFYESLGKTEQVRGMVTFFFVVATTGIIIMFAISIFWLDSSAEVTERFKSAKDLLTIVIGVLGTIMGFYFGSATGDTAKLSISALSPPVVHVGESPTITGHINGGTKPYKFTVVFTDPGKTLTDAQLKELNFDGDSADGTVKKKITPPSVQTSVVANYVLTATDAKNVKATSSGTLYLEPAKK